jgi:hypothetical protein
MKSDNLNFLETSGPFQACNGTDLPFCMPSCVRIPELKHDPDLKDVLIPLKLRSPEKKSYLWLLPFTVVWLHDVERRIYSPSLENHIQSNLVPLSVPFNIAVRND